jgi:hypothetical protein
MQPKDIDPSHMHISFVKSGVRIVAGILMIMSSEYMIMYAGLGFIIAEILGIAEEIV